MNPECSRCKKIVYPTEKLNCLDKYWHKSCFTCEVCNMTLNMKNYKGYDKNPYCTAHYPRTLFTAVADTPENRRLKQQTKMQSTVYYKEEFDRNKGKGFTVVSDTPELQRIKKTQHQISNVKYHEDYEKRRMQGPEERLLPPPQAEPEHHPSPAMYQPPRYEPERAPERVRQPVPEPEPEPQPAVAARASGSGQLYRAMYDYTAADDDEVSFLDGDVIINAEPIDDGWMHGRVERTGQIGLLPANYVEPL